MRESSSSELLVFSLKAVAPRASSTPKTWFSAARAPIQWALSSPAPGRLERAFSARTSFAGGRCPLSSQIVSLPFASRHKRAPVRPSWAAATPATCLASSEESASPGSSPGVLLCAGGPPWPGTAAERRPVSSRGWPILPSWPSRWREWLPPRKASPEHACGDSRTGDRKSTRLNSSHLVISYAVFCLKKKKPCTRDDQEPQAVAHHPLD